MIKYLYIILITLLSFYNLSAQGEQTVAGELSISVKNNPQNKTITLTLELVSPVCWDENHYITEMFNGGTIGFSGYSNEGLLEFHVCWTSDPLFYYKTFGLGLYKVIAKVDNVVKDHFFIDYRTSDLPGAIGPGCSIDYALDFDVTAEKFYYRATQLEFSDYHSFWDLRTCVEHTTNGLEDYWDNCLAAIPQKNPDPGGRFEPLIVWGPYSGFQPTGYKIYWRYGETGNFSLLQTVGANTFTFRHENLAVGQGLQAYYKVKAYNSQVESNFTNTASMGTSGWYQGYKRNLELDNYKMKYTLEQNYPNPFNPTTIISYTLPKSAHVILRVYDILGKEVATLVNEQKEAGTHRIEFDASNLAGGIYFYKIQTVNYTETRKLVLQN